MKCILREKLLAQAIKLSEVSALYRSESHRFVEAYFAWLEQAENDLSSLRSSISIMLQAEKSSLTSVNDGYVPPYIQDGKSIRKTQKAVAAQSLEKVSREIAVRIEQIDQDFEQQREKMCHAVAVLASRHTELYASLTADQSGAATIWNMLGATPETIPMYNYFCAKLAATDLNYLLLDVIQNIVANTINTGQ